MKRESTILMTLVIALMLIGILMVYSASAAGTVGGKYDTSYYLTRELIYAGIGLVAMVVAARIDYRLFREPWVYRLVALASLATLVLVLIPGLGIEVDGGRRWLKLPGFRPQPSEFAKIAVLLLIAAKLTENHDHIRSFRRGVLPPLLIMLGFNGLILLERDLGVPVVIGVVTMLLIIVAGGRWFHVVLSMIPACAGVAYLCVTAPHRVERLLAYADPWENRIGGGYQLIQSLAAFARGGLWGQGPGGSEQKLFYLPAANTDFIFAIWGEEMGLVGTLAMVVLFAAFLVVSLRVATCARDRFGALLAVGIATLIAFQAALNMAVNTGLTPTKGLPLPFVSFGGSAMIVFAALSGILVNIGMQAVDPAQVPRYAAAR